MIYDTLNNSFNTVRPKGISFMPRKDHCSTIYGKYFIDQNLIPISFKITQSMFLQKFKNLEKVK